MLRDIFVIRSLVRRTLIENPLVVERVTPGG
jgi:hypothetical protein